MNTTATPRERTDNTDICTVLTRLIDAEGIDANDMQDFMLDHAHNQARLAQVLRELAAAGDARAA